ncbi:GL26236 [Drosophila persimilis]|uniref:GL26236 n=1 Tax=Drosophila persimilis TaxID=7234 RepID=B4GJ90_DROPE|nr:GL26236 [Drosophila persimilis]
MSLLTRLLHTSLRCSSSRKSTHPSADRNSQPIADALVAQVDKNTPNLQLLEIASGSGQHAGFLAPFLPNISIQPTENAREMFSSISAYAADCVTGNIRAPLHVDITEEPGRWEAPPQAASYDYMFNSNMMHISPWSCSVGLFRAAGVLLKKGGKMFTYGPYAQDGVLQPQSNVDFDRSLRQRNPSWGVRDIKDLKDLATENGLRLEKLVEMPSNNKFLTWLKL